MSELCAPRDRLTDSASQGARGPRGWLERSLQALRKSFARALYSRSQYVLNKPPANWTGGVGFVTQEMIEQHMPSIGAIPGSGKVLMCGPPPMLNAMK